MNDQPVPSPCISVCRLDASGTLCVGCFRTRDEIFEWSMVGRQRQLEILDRARDRADGDG